MRHLKSRRKLGRKSQHRDLMLANMVVSLIKHSRIKTTLAKAKVVRPLAEKIVTLGKKGTLHHRRLAIAKLRAVDAVSKLFKEIAPKFMERKGGYTRITKLGPRNSDSAPEAFLEWVDIMVIEPSEPKTEGKKGAKKTEASTEKPAEAKETKAEKTETKKPAREKAE
jgi:large subunit ribosomal protein L17